MRLYRGLKPPSVLFRTLTSSTFGSVLIYRTPIICFKRLFVEFDADVAIPDVVAMVLESDIAAVLLTLDNHQVVGSGELAALALQNLLPSSISFHFGVQR